MSTITTYERLPLRIPPEQTEPRVFWKGWSWKLLKPQQEFANGLGKLMGAQIIGFIITALLSEISSQGGIARELDLHLTDTYYQTCIQAESAFFATMISTIIYSFCTYGYFLKKNNETISPKMQVAIQHRIRDEVRAQLEKRRMPT